MPPQHEPGSNHPDPAAEAAIGDSHRVAGHDDDFGFAAFRTHPSPLGPGAIIGGVEIVALVATGGMGCVYSGRQGSPARTVAVKVVREGLMTPTVLRRFQREAELLGRLRHPGIAHIYVAGVESTPRGDRPYSIMEFIVEASTIIDHANRRGLPPRARVSLFTQVAAAVAHAHREGIVHRDLKPGNILVDGEGHPKVIDFGIARAAASSDDRLTTATEIGQLLGTVRYMAPEQLGIHGVDTDARSDVYALGLVLHELLLGILPYELSDRSVIEAGAILAARDGGDAASLARQLRATGIDRDDASTLAMILATCLEPRPADRYQHAGDVEGDLRRWLAGEAIQARLPTLIESFSRMARRHRAGATALLTGFTAVVVTLVVVAWAWRTAEAERRLAGEARVVADAARRVAESQRAEAEASATDAKRQLYFSTVLLAAEARDRDNLTEARRLLSDARGLAPAVTSRPIELDYLAASLDESLTAFDADDGTVTAVAATRHGRAIAFGTEHGRLAIWKPNEPPRDVTTLDGRIWSVAFSTDGNQLAVGTSDGHLLVYDVSSGQEVARIAAHDETIYGLDFSPDGHLLATASRDRSARLWDADSWELRGSLTGHDETVLFVAFSPENRRVLTTSADGTARIWNVRTRKEMTRMSDGQGRVFRGAWSNTGERVATASEDGNARVYDAESKVLQATFAHPHRVNSIAFSPDDRHLVTASGDAVLRAWDMASASLAARRQGHADSIWSLAVTRQPSGTDGTSLGEIPVVTGSSDGTVRTWDLGRAGESLYQLGGRGVAVATSPKGDVIAVSSDAGEIHLLDPLTLCKRLTFIGLSGRVNGLAFSPDGNTLAATDDAGMLRRWRLADAEPLPTFALHVRRAFDVSFAPDGTVVATAGEDRVARVLDAKTGHDHAPPLKHPSRVFCVAFDPRGDRLATACEDRHIRLWNTTTGSLETTLPGHTRAVNWVCFSHDGSRLASASSDGTVRVWNAVASRTLKTTDGPPAPLVLTGPSRQVWKVAFSPDNSRLAATSADGLVQLWDTDTGRAVSILRGHGDEIWGLAFLRDGRGLVTTSWDGTLRLWGVPVAKLAAARNAATMSKDCPAGVPKQ